jgi:hypothetical protein
MLRTSRSIIAILLALSTVACSGGRSMPVSPLSVALPRISSSDPAAVRAGKLARYIERRWPRILVERIHTEDGGAVVAFNDIARFDASIGDPAAYERDVRRLTGDLDQASVELLQLAVRYFPKLRFATVWQDKTLQAFWSKEEIVAMDRPERYRNHAAFLKLIFSAQYPPDGGIPPSPPTS